MATFDDHVIQAKRNLVFLENTNKNTIDSADWQVTICFYTALHLVNAHLATFELQYRRHIDVKDVLNPYTTSPAKIPEDEYVAYLALQTLSRRARYLVEEKDNNLKSDRAFLTHDKHLAKALRHLDKLIILFSQKYKIDIKPIFIKCDSLKPQELTFVKKV